MAKKIGRKGRKAIHALLKPVKGYNAESVDDAIAQANREAPAHRTEGRPAD